MVAALVAAAVSGQWAAPGVQELYRRQSADSHQKAVQSHVHEDHLVRGRDHSQHLSLVCRLGHTPGSVLENRQAGSSSKLILVYPSMDSTLVVLDRSG